MDFIRSGTFRQHRTLPAILPDSVKLDNRSLPTLLTLVKKVGGMIKFYGAQNNGIQHWQHLFEKNSIFFLAEIINADMKEWHNEGINYVYHFYPRNYFEGQKNMIEDSDQQRIRREVILSLISHILDKKKLLDTWLAQAEKVGKIVETLRTKVVIKNKIAEFNQENSFTNKDNEKVADFLQTAQADLNTNGNVEKKTYKFSTTDFSYTLKNLFLRVKSIFNELFTKLIHIQQIAQQELTTTLSQKSNHDPLVGLLVAFLKVYQLQQQQLNGLTAKHLAYYYQQILKEKPQKAIKDHAHVFFSLKDGATPHFLPKGTRLLADINDDGLASEYETLHDTWVNHAKIKALKTLYVSRNPDFKWDIENKESKKDKKSDYVVTNIFYAPIANSINGEGLPLNMSKPSWALLGEEQREKASQDTTMIAAEMGWAISAPILHLSGGIRKVAIKIQLTEFDSFNDIKKAYFKTKKNNNNIDVNSFDFYFQKALKLLITTENGWNKIERFTAEFKLDAKEEYLVLALGFELPKEFPAVTLPDAPMDNLKIPCEWPTLKVLFKPYAIIYPYSLIAPLELSRILINVSVNEVDNLSIINDDGVFDNGQPFPFLGSFIQRNARVLIGNRELYLKKLNHLELSIQWHNLFLLNGSLATYYKNYKDQTGQLLHLNHDSFLLKIAALSNSNFFPAEKIPQATYQLFNTAANSNQLKPYTDIRFTPTQLEYLRIEENFKADLTLPPYDNDAQIGYIRLILTNPVHAFGQSLYPQLLANTITHNALAAAKNNWWKLKKEAPLPLPNEPFVPIAKKVSLNYGAECILDFEKGVHSQQKGALNSQVFQIHPGGFVPIFKAGNVISKKLIGSYDDTGYLMIGLEDLIPGLPLNFVFEILPDDLNINEGLNHYKWYYLADNTFHLIKKEEFYYDSTAHFEKNGIISLFVPEAINKNNTLLSNQYHWLVVVGQKSFIKVLAKTAKIEVNGVETSWVNNGDAIHYKGFERLPTIQNLNPQQENIAEVKQFGPFWGGIPEESTSLFWARLSERLRHKERAVNLWDYERLVIQKFPTIKQVKCIPIEETTPRASSSSKPKPDSKPNLKVILVSERIGATQIRPLISYTERQVVQQYLEQRCSPHVILDIVNPNYEELKLSMSIVLKKELLWQQGKWIDQLYKDLKYFICPWLNAGQVRIGNGFSKLSLVKFLQSRTYISFLTKLSIVHVYQEEHKRNGKNTPSSSPEAEQLLRRKKYRFNLRDSADADADLNNTILPSCPWGIFIPAKVHNIEIISKPIFDTPKSTTIGDLAIGTDFLTLKDSKDKKEAPTTGKKETKETSYFYISI